MSSWAAEIRRREAERRREEREALRQHKDLERYIKERARLSEQQKARLDVQIYENAVGELLSVHKRRGTRIEWVKFAAQLSPPEPLKADCHGFSARLVHCIAPLSSDLRGGIVASEEARLLDEQAHRAEHATYRQKFDEWTRMRSLAKRVLAGEARAYSEAIAEFASFSEAAGLEPSVQITIHGPKLVGCTLTVKGREVVPAETKSLTASGKLSTKALPKARSQEIYQSYVCGCILRVAREMFALLPVNEVLLTATVNGTDDRTGHRASLPVLSVAIDRAAIERLNFERLDPTGAIENFVHRGDAKATRRSGELASIVPLTPEDLAPTRPERLELGKLLTKVRQLRAEVEAKLKPIESAVHEDAPEELLGA